jgi:hypothetical protein
LILDTKEKEALVSAHQIQNRLNHLNLVTNNKVIDRILARIPKTTLQTVKQAKKDQWLPVMLYCEINDCIAAEIGDEGCYNLSFRSFNKVVDSSIVSPFFRAALNLFKVNPKTVLKLFPIFTKSIYRNTGEVSILEKGPTRVQILFKNLPPFVAGNRNHLMGLAGGIHAVFSFSGAKALVILEKFSAETGEATFIASWSSNLMKDKKC